MVQSERALGREEAVPRALALAGETYGQGGLERHLRGLWGGVVSQREASEITGGAHTYTDDDDELPVWVMVFEGPFVYQFSRPLRLFIIVVMSAETAMDARLYDMGAPPAPVDVWRLENMSRYLQSALGSAP